MNRSNFSLFRAVAYSLIVIMFMLQASPKYPVYPGVHFVLLRDCRYRLYSASRKWSWIVCVRHAFEMNGKSLNVTEMPGTVESTWIYCMAADLRNVGCRSCRWMVNPYESEFRFQSINSSSSFPKGCLCYFTIQSFSVINSFNSSEKCTDKMDEYGAKFVGSVAEKPLFDIPL
jgi:hypothetical protein